MTTFATSVAGCLLMANQVTAQVSLSAGTYSQNFDILPNVVVSSNSWVNGTTLSGWYANTTNVNALNFGYNGEITNLVANLGSTSSGFLYSYGANGLGDRALGSQAVNAMAASGLPALAYGIRFTNDTGVALTNFTISYTGEQWRNAGVAVAHTLAFSYRIDNAPIINADPSSVSTWVAVPALSFASPVFSASAASLDGNLGANRTVFSPVILSGFVVLPGQEIFFRWLDTNESGNDHALAIDDLTIAFETNATAVASAPSIATPPANATIGAGGSATFTVTANGTQPLSYYWYATNSGVTDYVGSLASFTTNLVPLAASGYQFYVIVTNVAGAVTSSVATITVTNVIPVTTNIAYLHTLQNANFVLTNTSTLFSATGIVTTTDNLTSGSTVSFHIQDETGGIDVFHYTANGPFLGGVPNAGDLVRVTAPLAQFNGLMELAPTNANPTHEITVLSSGNPIPAPAVFDFTTINPAVMESFYEGRLVVVSNVFLAVTNVSGVVIAGQSIYMTNLVGQTFRLINPTPAIEPQGLPLPAFAASVRGVMSQSDSAVPLDAGYSMYLLRSSDIEAGTPPTAPTPESLQISVSGGNAVLTWTSPLFNLQASPSVTGTYTNIPGATSPYSYPISGGERYFRLAYP